MQPQYVQDFKYKDSVLNTLLHYPIILCHFGFGGGNMGSMGQGS